MRLTQEQLNTTAEAFVDQSLASSVVEQRGFQFMFDGVTGAPIVVEWEKGIEGGHVVRRPKDTNLFEWLTGLCVATGVEPNKSDVSGLGFAIIERVHINLGIRKEV